MEWHAPDLLRRYEIAHHSMAPHLEPGDFVVAVPLGAPHRGEIVIVPHPNRPGLDLIKRIVGLPGEHIEISDGGLEVNGVVRLEPWARGATEPQGAWNLETEIFVLGDQRETSTEDSRTIGPIPLDADNWKVVFRYWPPKRLGVPVTTGEDGGSRVEMALHKDVDAPIDVVWRILTDLDRSPLIIGAIEDIERLDDGRGFAVGTRWRETRRMFGREATEEMEITALDPGRSYTVEADGTGAHYVSVMSLEETDTGTTRLSMTFAAQPDGLVNKVMANTLGRLFLGTTRKALERDLEDIAQAATG